MSALFPQSDNSFRSFMFSSLCDSKIIVVLHEMFASKANPASSPSSNQDDPLTNEIELINRYEKLRKNVYDEFKKLNNHLYDLNCAEKRMIGNLSALTSLNQSEEKLSHLLQGWNELINASMNNRQDMAININRTVTEPLKKFQIAFNEIKSAIKRYEQLCNDDKKYSQKLAEYKRCERTANIVVKQRRNEQLLKQNRIDMQRLMATMQRELPLFLQKRIDYFQPSLAAFICSNIYHSGSNFKAISESELKFDTTEQDRLREQDQLFKTIDGLSIVSS